MLLSQLLAVLQRTLESDGDVPVVTGPADGPLVPLTSVESVYDDTLPQPFGVCIR